MALWLVMPLRSISSMIGSTLAANCLAFAFTAATPRFAALASAVALVLGHHGQNVYRELIRVRVIHGGELNARLHQRGNEGQIAGQSVKFGDNQAI
jgi:hypothetical protein